MSAVLGAPLLFITAQLMLGRSTLWMPRFICERSISRDFFALLTAKLSPILHRAERFLRPRISMLLHPVPERIVGAACLLLAIILFLPIPFGNIPPAFAIAAFCARDPGAGWSGHDHRLARDDRQRPDPGRDFVSDHCRDPRLSRPAVGYPWMTDPATNPTIPTSTTPGVVPRAPDIPVLELGIAVLLIGLNGLFALSELAIVSARKARLKTMADNGRAGAATALRLAEDPAGSSPRSRSASPLSASWPAPSPGAALGDRAHRDPARPGACPSARPSRSATAS